MPRVPFTIAVIAFGGTPRRTRQLVSVQAIGVQKLFLQDLTGMDEHVLFHHASQSS
jgi:uncharacterized protein YegL